MAPRVPIVHPNLGLARGGGQLLDAVTLQRPSGGSDTEGFPDTAWTTIATVTQAHLTAQVPKKGAASETDEASRSATHAEALIAFAAGADVRVGDLVTFTATAKKYVLESVDPQRLKVRCFGRRTA